MEDVMKRLVMLGVVGLIGVSAMAACGDDDDASSVTEVQEANAQFCQDLAAYGSAVASFGELDPTTATKDDYTSAADNVKSAREALVSSGEDLGEAEWANLQTQVETLTGQLQDAPDDETVSSIMAGAATQVATVQASVASLNTAVCTSANVTTTTG
jgi:hypothetical protein